MSDAERLEQFKFWVFDLHKRLQRKKNENQRLRASLYDIASGAGMFGVDHTVDLDWAMSEAGRALKNEEATQ
jgi:hypothetical protein